MVMEGQIQVISRHTECQESVSLDSYEENSKDIWIYAHILMYAGLRSKSHVHASMGLKLTYNNKHVFFRDDIGTSNYNTSPWGLMSLQRHRECHKCVITWCGKTSYNRCPLMCEVIGIT